MAIKRLVLVFCLVFASPLIAGDDKKDGKAAGSGSQGDSGAAGSGSQGGEKKAAGSGSQDGEKEAAGSGSQGAAGSGSQDSEGYICEKKTKSGKHKVLKKVKSEKSCKKKGGTWMKEGDHDHDHD